MLVGIYQSFAILLVVVAFYVMDFVFIARYDRKRRSQGSGRNWRFTLMIMAMAVFMVAQPIAWPWMGLRIESGWAIFAQFSGLMLVGGALILNVWARIHLQHFYAERVEIQEGHRIIEAGPYAYVRHPIFTSFFLIVIGLVLINPSLATGLVALYTFWDFTHAAKKEENLLSSHMPDYVEYMRHTARFFPRLVRNPKSSK